MKSTKVRFNLSRGKNYMKWKVEYPDKTVEYHDIAEVQLVMSNCKLKNYRNVAEKIYKGANKEVCAWVLCEDLFVLKTPDYFLKDQGYDRIRYNPREIPHWVYKDEMADGMSFNTIISIDYGLYCTKK
jgi:hypothetical protein